MELLVNDVWVERGEITVGATDRQRWQWELDDGRDTGVDAKTLVSAVLRDPGKRRAIEESVALYVDRSDPLRAAALAAIPALLEAAWEIREQRWDAETARAELLGRSLSVPESR